MYTLSTHEKSNGLKWLCVKPPNVCLVHMHNTTGWLLVWLITLSMHWRAKRITPNLQNLPNLSLCQTLQKMEPKHCEFTNFRLSQSRGNKGFKLKPLVVFPLKSIDLRWFMQLTSIYTWYSETTTSTCNNLIDPFCHIIVRVQFCLPHTLHVVCG